MLKGDPNFERWPPESAMVPQNRQMPGWLITIWRGVCARCPQCGEGRIFDGYLKVTPHCSSCAANLGEMPSDDAPPYIAMVAVLHAMGIFTIIYFKGGFHPGVWMWGFSLLSLVCVCLIALRLAKGGVIGVLLKLGLKREALRG